VEVSDYLGNGTGTYEVHVQRLTAAAACPESLLSCDTPLGGEITGVTDTDLYRVNFTVAEGERLGISLTRVTPTAGSFDPVWRLLDGAGNPVADLDCDASETGRSDCGPLAASGNPYHIEVKDYASNGTGTYELDVQRLPAAAACEGILIPCDGVVSDRIGQLDGTGISESDLFRLNFTVGEGERVQVDVARLVTSSGSFDPVWRLLDGAGNPVGDVDCDSNETGPSDCGPLLMSGNPYRVEVTDYLGNGTGTYEVHVQRLPASATCPGGVCAIESVSDTDLFPVAVSEGQVLSIEVVRLVTTAGSFDPVWRLLTPAGIPVTDLDCDALESGLRTCGPLSAGTHHIEVADYASNGMGTYDVRVNGPSICSTATSTTTTSTTTTSTSTSRPSPSPPTPTTSTTRRPPSTTSTTQPGTCGTLGMGTAVAAAPPGEFCVDMVLDNPSRTVRAVQATVIDVPDEFQFSRVLCTARTPGFSCQGNEAAATNRVAVVVLDLGGSCIAAGTGAIAQVCFTDRLPQCPSLTSVDLNLDPASVQVGDCSSQPCGVVLSSGRVSCGCQPLGDCQADGDFDLFDVLFKIDVVLGWVTPTAEQRCRCDDTCDGRIDNFDVLREIDAILGRIPTPLTVRLWPRRRGAEPAAGNQCRPSVRRAAGSG
jgi:hypothetical protein